MAIIHLVGVLLSETENFETFEKDESGGQIQNFGRDKPDQV